MWRCQCTVLAASRCRVPTRGREEPEVLVVHLDCQRVGVRLRPRRSAGGASGGSEGNGPQVGQRSGERGGPGPLRRSAQGRCSGSVHQSSRDREVAGPQGAGDHQGVLFDEVTEVRTPADQVVSEHGTAHPRRVGREVTRRTVLHARSLLPVVDAQLDDGVASVEGVELDRVGLEVTQEGEVPPVGPQARLGADKAGAAHDEAPSLVGALGDHGLAADRSTRWRPSPTRESLR